MRYLGIDYGLKETGLALGDEETKMTFPIEQVDAGRALARIAQIIEADSIDALVVGMPYGSSGEIGKQGEVTQKFVESLRQFAIPVHVVTERHTTQESRRLQEETGTREGKDALAAMLILQEFFSQ